MERESFIFYASFYEAMKYLPDADYIAVSKAVFEYAIYGNEIELVGIANGFFQLIKPQIDANNRRRDNGIKGGAPRGNANANKQPKSDSETTETAETKQPKSDSETTETAETKQPELNFKTTETAKQNNLKQPNVNVNVNVNVNDNVNDNDNVLGGDFENSAVAGATTQTEESETDFSTPIVENSASPKKEEKGCGEKEERETVEERILKFRQKVSQIAQGQNYPADIVEDFCRYWLEMNEGGKKMRFETEKIFNHQMRLVTWINNEKKWKAQRKPASRPTTTAQSPAASNSVDDIWGVNNH